MGEGIAGTVAATGKSMNIKDAYACEMFNPTIDRATDFLTKTVLCCPIADISGKYVAVVQVDCSCSLQAMFVLAGLFLSIGAKELLKTLDLRIQR